MPAPSDRPGQASQATPPPEPRHGPAPAASQNPAATGVEHRPPAAGRDAASPSATSSDAGPSDHPPRAASPPPAWLFELAGALRFLTVLPLPRSLAGGSVDLSRATAYFPVAGYVIGAVLGSVAWLLATSPAGLRGAVLLAAWLAVTGMLHLDGLLDCADALLSAATPERRLEILRDPRAGSFAVGAGVAFLLLKWQAIALVPDPWLLVGAPALARFAVLLPLSRYRPARADGLAAQTREPRMVTAGLLALPAIALAPFAAAAALLVALGGAAWAARKLGGGITGDVCGALIELAELAVLLALAGLHHA